jgi:hypothetical protein
MATMTAPPMIGKTQKNQTWPRDAVAKSAGPVLRAGFTERLVTGIPMRWISVSPSPMAIGAKPAGARESVAPMMMKRNIIVSTSPSPRCCVSGNCAATASIVRAAPAMTPNPDVHLCLCRSMPVPKSRCRYLLVSDQ